MLGCRGIKDIKTKSRFLNLIKEKGYTTIEEFAKDCEMKPQSVFTHIRGEYLPGVKKLFKYSEVLKVDITTMLKIFYPKEMKRNEKYGSSNTK